MFRLNPFRKGRSRSATGRWGSKRNAQNDIKCNPLVEVIVNLVLTSCKSNDCGVFFTLPLCQGPVFGRIIQCLCLCVSVCAQTGVKNVACCDQRHQMPLTTTVFRYSSQSSTTALSLSYSLFCSLSLFSSYFGLFL